MEQVLARLAAFFERKKILHVVLRAPITIATGSADFSGNVAAIRNGGTSTVVINGGAWTLLPGESLHFGSQTDVNEIIWKQVSITFDTTLGALNKLQILEVRPQFC